MTAPRSVSRYPQATGRLESLERLRQELALQGNSLFADSDIPSDSTSSVPEATPGLPEPHRSMLLTVPEACSELRISRAQFYILANKQRAIETVHIGKLCRVPREALENYVANLRSGVSL